MHISLLNKVQELAIAPRSSPADMEKSFPRHGQITFYKFICFVLSHAAELSERLKSQMLDYEKELEAHARPENPIDLCSDIQAARRRFADDRELLERLRHLAQDVSFTPLYLSCTSAFEEAHKAYDDAIEVIRDMRILRLMAAKYA